MHTEPDTNLPEIIFRNLIGDNLSSREQETLEEWLAETEKNQLLFQKIASGASLKSYEEILSMINVPEGITAVKSKIKKQQSRRRLIRVGAAAAAIITGMVVATQVYFTTGSATDSVVLFSAGSPKALLTINEEKIQLTEKDHETTWQEHVASLPKPSVEKKDPRIIKMEVPRGGEYKLRLPDGTSVWLNAETVIEYPEQFTGEKREVRLSGEAFFDVTPDAGFPFVIETHDQLNITVLGTRFNVNNYRDETNTVITLVEGSVKVCSDSDSVTLQPREQAVFHRADDSLSVLPVSDIKAYTAWKDGQFYHRSTPLNVIFSGLERWYNVEIIYNEADLSAVGDVTLLFSRMDDLISVLESLKELTGLQYRIEKSSIYIRFN